VSSTGKERSRCTDDGGADLLDVALAQQSRRRTVVQLGVEALHPRLGDARRFRLAQHRGDLQRHAEPLLHTVGRLPGSFGPLVHGPRLAYRAEICDQAGAKELSQCVNHFGERGANRLSVGREAGSRISDSH
jgi:hypothetical protein